MRDIQVLKRLSESKLMKYVWFLLANVTATISSFLQIYHLPCTYIVEEDVCVHCIYFVNSVELKMKANQLVTFYFK